MKLLDSPNSLPFPLTIRHYHVFSEAAPKSRFKDGALDSPESWDMLRQHDPMFLIPDSREEWVRVAEEGVRKDGQDARLKERAAFIAAFLREKKITTLFSIGSGGAGLEYLIKKQYPELAVVCSEYAPASVARLKQVFVEAEEVRSFDLRAGDWTALTSRRDAASTAFLLYRLDAQFTDAEWESIFFSMHDAGVRFVLYLPTGFLTLRNLIARMRQRLAWRRAGKELVYSGRIRTLSRFRSYWRRHFSSSELVVAGMTGFWLVRK